MVTKLATNISLAMIAISLSMDSRPVYGTLQPTISECPAGFFLFEWETGQDPDRNGDGQVCRKVQKLRCVKLPAGGVHCIPSAPAIVVDNR